MNKQPNINIEKKKRIVLILTPLEYNKITEGAKDNYMSSGKFCIRTILSALAGARLQELRK